MQSRLVDSDQLRLALDDIHERNRFLKKIDSLDNLNQTDNQNFYKLVLALWLGANHALLRVKKYYPEEFVETGLNIFKIYHCLLSLNKHITLLSRDHSATFELVSHSQKVIFEFYNSHYQILLTDHTELLLFFKKTIVDIGSPYNPDLNYCHIEKMRDDCLQNLTEGLYENYLLSNSFWTRFVVNDKLDLMNLNTTFNIQINKFISSARVRLPFYSEYLLDASLKIHKVFLKMEDGIMIDGLQVKLKNLDTNHVVLALIGHFSSEHSYISANAIEFCSLFGGNIVFMNHRNFSQQSAEFATSIDRLAQDVVNFAKYFHAKGKNIILYGMCGGAAHIILAAQMLQKDKIKFKLIVDRFPSQYSDFTDVKTQVRLFQFYDLPSFKPLASMLERIPSTLILVLAFYFIIFVISKLLLIFSNTNKNFGNIIRKIPENDLLILQAKSAKINGQEEPISTDMIVHPKNDIRNAVKDVRQKNKQILTNLNNQCSIISDLCHFDLELKKSFSELSDFFKFCLELIQNEKLKNFNINPLSLIKNTEDCHSYPLFQLTTRNNQPLNLFIKGFFKPGSKNWRELLEAVHICSYAEIASSLSQLYKSQFDSNMDKLIKGLNLFLKTFVENKEYIYYISNRLSMTSTKDINSILQKIFDSDLFNSLNKSNKTNQLFHFAPRQ